ncbi:protein kinase domain-containing protein [Psychrobacter sp. I-STPA10]|uniref:protein kinase domain-containing protein n=1 Tax=Psychrobacter sp. I-STPA10 TaxID=2585769 RepID=UPI001E3409E6|nr:protein kinase [Psychrobacter sp. I-STPA10]
MDTNISVNINDTLKNWVNNCISHINQQLYELGYQQIKHKRLSFMQNEETSQSINLSSQYQQTKVRQLSGLSKAVDADFGEVIIKWQLRPCLVNQTHYKNNFDTLAYEHHALLALSENGLDAILPVYDWQTRQLELNIENANIEVDSNEGRQGSQQNEYQLPQHSHAYWQFSSLTLPYYHKGSVQDYLKQQQTPLTPIQKYALLLAMAQALATIHQCGWVHGDIKPSNFLITATSHTIDMAYHIVLIDFVLAHKIDGIYPYHQPCGTPAYLAPECWHGQSGSIQSDVYAFGIMMVEILMGKRPFHIIKNMDSAEQQQNSENSEYRQWAIQHCQTLIPMLPSQWHRYQPIIARLLAKHKHHRYDSMVQVMTALQQL